PELHRLLADKSQPADSRANTLAALVALGDPEVESTARAAIADDSPLVRSAARTGLAQRGAADAVALLNAAVNSGERIERQAALAALGTITDTAATAILAEGLDQFSAGSFPVDARL